MSLDLAAIISRTFSISWRHKWLWLLGVFGGGGGSLGAVRAFPTGRFEGNPGGTGATLHQLQAFFAQNAWVLVLVGAAVVVLAVVVFLFTCVAVPAAIWAALHLDAGDEVSLGQAWRAGTGRFGPFVRLYLIRLGIGLVLAAPLALSALLLVAGILKGGAALAGAILVFVGVLALFLVASLVLGLALIWSERLLVLRGLGAVAAIRESWWLMRRTFLDTVVFAVLMGLLAGVIGVGVSLAALVAALPGIVAAVIGFSSPGPLLLAGATWILVFGLGVLLVGGGFVGSLVQVAYALACRDLCRRHGLQVVEGRAPVAEPPGAPRPAPAT